MLLLFCLCGSIEPGLWQRAISIMYFCCILFSLFYKFPEILALKWSAFTLIHVWDSVKAHTLSSNLCSRQHEIRKTNSMRRKSRKMHWKRTRELDCLQIKWKSKFKIYGYLLSSSQFYKAFRFAQINVHIFNTYIWYCWMKLHRQNEKESQKKTHSLTK